MKEALQIIGMALFGGGIFGFLITLFFLDVSEDLSRALFIFVLLILLGILMFVFSYLCPKKNKGDILSTDEAEELKKL